MKCFASVLAAVVVLAGASWAAAETYTVDPVHSSAVFRIKHNNAAYFHGIVSPGPDGTVVYDAAKPEASSFDVTLKLSGVNTGNAQRDNHLKSPTFFATKDFPTATFKSTSVKAGEGKTLQVTGDFTLHGVTKSITVPIEFTGEGKGMQGGVVAGFEGTFTVSRKDYGITEMAGMLGDDVRITVSLEAGKK